MKPKLGHRQKAALVLLARRACRRADLRSFIGPKVRPEGIDLSYGIVDGDETLKRRVVESLEPHGLVEIAYHHDWWVCVTTAGLAEAARIVAKESSNG
jgi:hypothetical protein